MTDATHEKHLWVQSCAQCNPSGPAPRQQAILHFRLHRVEDVSGVSGTGVVAVGVVFPSGRAVMEWLGPPSSTCIYSSIGDVERIHGHEGRTKVELL